MTELHDMTEAEWDKCWAVNVKGQMALLRAALPQFKKNKDGGSFIMTSSIAVSAVKSCVGLLESYFPDFWQRMPTVVHKLPLRHSRV